MNAEARKSLGIATGLLDELQTHDPSEIRRMATHSAYYVMYHAARAVLLDAHGTVSTKHGSVLDAFGLLVREESPEIQRWAKEFRAAYAARLQSDYLGKVLSPTEAAELVALATDFVAYCARRLGVEPPPTARP